MTGETGNVGAPDDGGRLDRLMDYTKFHIGIYLTLFASASALIAAADDAAHQVLKPWLYASAICFILAGAAGGIIASSVPEYSSFDDFKTQSLGPWWWGGSGPRYRFWAAVEHSFFWVALSLLAGSLMYGDASLWAKLIPSLS